jgi:LAO/AO transport system kinase
MGSMEKRTTKPTALQEKEGIPAPEIVNEAMRVNVQRFRKQQPTVEDLTAGILAHDITALSRGITLVESTNPIHLARANALITACLPHANASVRIGITGVPGAGKSTFIEAFGTHLTSLGKKVAVLAVDPSSSISHGSILGDKTRMEELVKDSNAYIRPSASGDTLGGVARKTRETITLCEAAGFDVILIETVGVGQSETAVHSMVDFFLLLKLSGAGDELQGIKRGIMEMADAIVINKADGDNIAKAKLAKTEFNRALHLFPAKASGWTPRVSTCSAYYKMGISEVWELISEYITLTEGNGYFSAKRTEQNHYWMTEAINEALKHQFYTHPVVAKELQELQEQVKAHSISPFVAAQQLLATYFKTLE